MSKDYYQILGIKKDATDNEIKSAYRKLARVWHPDVAKDKTSAEEKFKEINEAYQILGDSKKRSQYDQFGSAAAFGGASSGNGNPFSGSGPFQWSYSSGSEGFGQDSGGGDPFDIFEQVFGFRGFGGQRRAHDVQYSLSINFVDSIKGFEETINVDGQKLKVKLPPGVRDGTRVKFAGKGEQGRGQIQSGDLYIVIQIKPDPNFARQGIDIFSMQEISMAQAALGDTILVRVVEPTSKTGFSEKRVKIQGGTQPGIQVRLRGQGMQNPNGMGRGDHYLSIKVIIPQRLTREQRESLKTFL